jgi:ribosomal protein S18 acetylase RimI-like enzyme
MSAGPAVRPAGTGDLDTVDAIEAASFDRDRFPRRNLARMLRGGRTVFLVAGSAGYVAVCFRRGASVARIYSLAVRPEARGQGVAARLIKASRDLAREAGCDRLRLEVRLSNAAARRLYEREGFRLRKRLEDYYEDGETALQLEAVLHEADPRPAGETTIP